ncbi:MAG: DUF2156 domain-containing protein [Candidatus Latescibacteria bacterium]|nr:DUF2156 domain-containing protein [Candidatus Latescibacterota bacterium]
MPLVKPRHADEQERGRVLLLLRKYGWNATSFQVLEQGFQYWFCGDDACVAYVDTGNSWVAAGAPITGAERLGEVAQAFVAAASHAGRRASFFAVERRFIDMPPLQVTLIGEQPVWNPAMWSAMVDGHRSLREQLRRARAKGVVIRAVSGAALLPPDAPLRLAIDALIRNWLAGRPLAPMGFLVDVQPFSHGDERRYFVAEWSGRIIGFLAAVPIYTRKGWLFEDLLRDRCAPNGTAELLIDFAMRDVARVGSSYATLGLAPLAGPVALWLGVARVLSASFYDFRGVQTFRAKLRPDRWDPIYLVYPSAGRPAVLESTAALWDVLTAFARGRLVSFGVETLLRGPALVIRLLALLLVPWTILLSLVAVQLFPSPAVRAAWVAFDATLTLVLFTLAARWRRWLGVAVATAVSLDAITTSLQVALFNLERVSGPFEAIALVIAIGAPMAAALILWKAVGHHHSTDQRLAAG